MVKITQKGKKYKGNQIKYVKRCLKKSEAFSSQVPQYRPKIAPNFDQK